jgi:hypothetical protein
MRATFLFEKIGKLLPRNKPVPEKIHGDDLSIAERHCEPGYDKGVPLERKNRDGDRCEDTGDRVDRLKGEKEYLPCAHGLRFSRVFSICFRIVLMVFGRSFSVSVFWMKSGTMRPTSAAVVQTSCKLL